VQQGIAEMSPAKEVPRHGQCYSCCEDEGIELEAHMHDQWTDDSTALVECYRKETRAGSAMVVRSRDRRDGYASFVYNGVLRCADTHFQSLEAAQEWADSGLEGVLFERAVGA
jgi:hypothetical protein